MAAALAFPSTFLVFHLLVIFFLFHQLHLTIAEPTTGFSLKLIHRDSPESPLYPGNLSKTEQIQRLVDFSETRYHELLSKATETVPIDDLHPDVIRPRVGKRGFLYFVQLKIGTPSTIYYLILDTGSALIWIQCLPCEPCFAQRQPTFNTSQSSTYITLPCAHRLCRGMDCVDGKCIYNNVYGSGQISKGTLSSEKFTFQSNTGSTEVKNDIVFGCSHSNQNFGRFDGDGILGMSYAELSLIIQISDGLAKKRFSYCLQRPGAQGTTFLRFDNDNIRPPRGGRIKATPFVSYRNPTMYALNLLDISINNHPIGFPQGTFAMKPDGTGGCLIDSGSSITFMDAQPYGILRQAMVQYFEQYHLQIVRYELDLCYRLPSGFNHFPSFTFHFQSADLEVMLENMFFINNRDHVFCLAMKPKNGFTLFGAMQQQNTRFVYDIERGLLQFVPEDCSQDPQ